MLLLLFHFDSSGEMFVELFALGDKTAQVGIVHLDLGLPFAVLPQVSQCVGLAPSGPCRSEAAIVKVKVCF